MSYAKNRVVIAFKPGLPEQQRLALHKRMGVKLVSSIPQLHAHIVTTAETRVEACVKGYKAHKGVQYVEKDSIVNQHLVPNDQFFSQQWGLTRVSAPQAWNVTRGLPTVLVAVLDTGISQNHPDLTAKIALNANFSSSGTINDLNGHGTHVAGIIGAITNNRIGVAGMGFQTRLMNIKVLNDQGSGFFSDVARGITFATDRGAKVINMSLGGAFADSTIQAAVQYATNRGVLLVASAGNNGTSQLTFPAAFPQVVSVAATGQNDIKASFSNFSASWVDVAAPGVTILSTLPPQANRTGQINYGFLSGTSMAAPFVSGLAALMIAVNPRLTPARITNLLGTTSDPVPGYGSLYRYGRINAFRAVSRARV